MHLVRAIGQAQRALHRPPVSQREVLGNPGATVDLDGAVDDLQRDVGCDHFDLRDLAGGDLVAHGVHHVRRVQCQQARHVDLDATLGDVVEVRAQPGQRLAEGGTADGTFAHQLQCAFRDTDRAHAVVDAARAETPLGDLEAAAFTEDDVLVRYPHVFQQHFRVAVRGVVVAEHRQRAQHLHAGSIHRHQNHRVLGVARCIRVGQAHEDHDLAARVAGAGGPPLATVDDPLVTLTHRAGLHVGGVGRSHARLGHAEGRTDFAAQQRFQPLALLRLAAVAHQHFHVAGIRRRAVERFRA